MPIREKVLHCREGGDREFAGDFWLLGTFDDRDVSALYQCRVGGGQTRGVGGIAHVN